MRILFVRQFDVTWIQRDLEILRQAYEVRDCHFRGIRDILTLFRGVLWCDATFSWLGKLHAFFAVLFSKVLGKKSLVVAGDEDVTKEMVGGKPYGLCAHPVKKWFAYFIFTNVDRVIAISKFSLWETVHNAKADPQKATLVYHGFEEDRFHKPANVAKEKLAVTVGQISHENYHRKGLKLFVESAQLLPEVTFVVVGSIKDSAIDLLKRVASPNVTFTGRLPEADLKDVLGRASVYVQASQHEGFGCSLAEAMLCECVPVVSRLTALPEVVGDCGIYIDHLEPEELANRIREALQKPELGKLARERIANEFPWQKRRDELLKVVGSLNVKGRTQGLAIPGS